jgi:hypothetical protein
MYGKQSHIRASDESLWVCIDEMILQRLVQKRLCFVVYLLCLLVVLYPAKHR